MSFTHLRRNEQGLTLVEIALVAVLLSLMSLILYGTLSGIIRTKTNLESVRLEHRTVQYVVRRMTRELTNWMEVGLNRVVKSAGAPPSIEPTGFFIRGTNRKFGDRDADAIRFVSADAGQNLSDGVQNFGAVEVEYRLEEQEDRNTPTGKKTLLVREEVPAGVTSAEILRRRTIVFPIAEDIVSLNFRYLRNGRWLDEWPSFPTVPEAVEITLGVLNQEQQSPAQEQTFRTAVAMKRRR